MDTLHQKPLLKYIPCVLWINVIEHIYVFRRYRYKSSNSIQDQIQTCCIHVTLVQFRAMTEVITLSIVTKRLEIDDQS